MSFDAFMPLLTYPDQTPVDAVLRAVDFAAILGGTLTMAAHVLEVPPISNPLVTPLVDFAAMSAAALATSRSRGEAIVRETVHFAQRFMLPERHSTFRCQLAALPEHLALLARTHDIGLMGIDPACPGHVEAAEGLIFGSGGPVALFPSGAAAHLQTVVVAWDGGRSAARAVRDAMPLLQRASKVVLLTVSDDKHVPPASTAALAEFLNGHRISSEHHDVMRETRPTGDVLQGHALEHDAGLLIMGAYGHSRLREFVLGGATRNVFASLRLPVFMSH